MKFLNRCEWTAGCECALFYAGVYPIWGDDGLSPLVLSLSFKVCSDRVELTATPQSTCLSSRLRMRKAVTTTFMRGVGWIASCEASRIYLGFTDGARDFQVGAIFMLRRIHKRIQAFYLSLRQLLLDDVDWYGRYGQMNLLFRG